MSDDGGPAFPAVQPPHNPGMSMRDVYELIAMHAIISKMPLHGINTDGSMGELVRSGKKAAIDRTAIALGASLMADAMLKQRQVTKNA